MYRIYLNTRRVPLPPPLNICGLCSVILNSHMKCQTGSLSTISCSANQGQRCQTVMWHHSSERLCSVEWQLLADILGPPIGLIFKSQENQKRENSTIEVNWQSSFFWACPTSCFLKKHNIQKPVLFLFSDKEAPNLVYTLDWAILNHCAP